MVSGKLVLAVGAASLGIWAVRRFFWRVSRGPPLQDQQDPAQVEAAEEELEQEVLREDNTLIEEVPEAALPVPRPEFRPPGIAIIPTREELEDQTIRQSRRRVHCALLRDSHSHDIQGGAGQMDPIFWPPGIASMKLKKSMILQRWKDYGASLAERRITPPLRQD